MRKSKVKPMSTIKEMEKTNVQKAIKEYVDGPILGWIAVNEPERKIKALSVSNFHFKRFYTLREYEEIDELTGKMRTQWFIGPCVTRI